MRGTASGFEILVFLDLGEIQCLLFEIGETSGFYYEIKVIRRNFRRFRIGIM